MTTRATLDALLNININQRILNTQLRNLSRSISGLNLSINTSQAVNNLNKANSTTQNLNNSLASSRYFADQFGISIGSAARNFAAYSAGTLLIIKLTGALKSAVSEAFRLEKQMLRISQVVNKQISEVSGLKEEVLDLSVKYGIASSKIGEIGVTLAQAGIRGRELSKALDAVIKSSVAPTFKDIASTADGAVAILKQFRLEAGLLEDKLGAVNAVSKNFAVEAEDIIEATKRAGGVFASAGGTFEEFISLFTSVRATTRESADTIATGLRTIFTRIQRPETIDFLRQMNIEIADTSGKIKDPLAAIKAISEQIKILGIQSRGVEYAQLVEQLGGLRQVGKLIPLLRETKLAQDALKVANEQAAGSLEQDYLKAIQTLGKQFEIVREDFKKFVIELGDSGTLQEWADSAVNFSKGILEVTKSLKSLVPFLGLLGTLSLTRGFIGGLVSLRPRYSSLGTRPAGSNFHDGGMVSGTPGRDKIGPIPINGSKKSVKIENGEYVVRASEARKNLPLLDAINSGSFSLAHNGGVVKRATGGPVSGGSSGGVNNSSLLLFGGLAASAANAAGLLDGMGEHLRVLSEQIIPIGVAFKVLHSTAPVINTFRENLNKTGNSVANTLSKFGLAQSEQVRNSAKANQVTKLLSDSLSKTGLKTRIVNTVLDEFRQGMRSGLSVMEAREKVERRIKDALIKHGHPSQVQRGLSAVGQGFDAIKPKLTLTQKAERFGSSAAGKLLTGSVAVGLAAFTASLSKNIETLKEAKKAAEESGNANEAYSLSLKLAAAEAEQGDVRSGAIGGAAIGSIFGPIGIAIGGAIGSALGKTGLITSGKDFIFGTDSKRDAELEAKRARTEIVSAGISKRFEESISNIGRLRENARRAPESQQGERNQKIRDELLKTIDTLLENVRDDKSVSFLDKTEDLEKSFLALQSEIDSLAIPLTKTGKGFSDIEAENPKIVARFREIGNILGGSFYDSIQISIDAINESAELGKAEISARAANLKLIKENISLQNRFNQSLSVVNDSTLRQSGQIASLNAGLDSFSNKLVSSKVSVGSEVGSLDKDSKSFANVLESVRKISPAFKEQADLAADVSRRVSSFKNAFQDQALTISDAGTRNTLVNDLLKNIIGGTAGQRSAFNKQLDSLNTQTSPDEFNAIFLEMEKVLGQSAFKNVELGRKALEDNLIGLSELMSKRRDIESLSVENQERYAKRIREINDIFQKDKTFGQASIQRRSSAAATAGLVGFNITNNDKRSLSGLNKEIIDATKRLSELRKTMAESETTTASQIQQESNLISRITILNNAFEKLSDTSGELQALQDRFAKLEDRRIRVRDKSADLAFGGIGDRRKFAINRQLAGFAFQGGNVQNLPEELRASLFSFLNEFKDVGVFNGLTGQDLIDRQNAKFLQSSGFSQDFINGILKKQVPIEEQQLKALEKIIEVLTTGRLVAAGKASGGTTNVGGIAFKAQGTDRYPYMLSAGEGIVKTSAMNKGLNKDIVQRMNNGEVFTPNYAQNGGIVGQPQKQSTKKIPFLEVAGYKIAEAITAYKNLPKTMKRVVDEQRDAQQRQDRVLEHVYGIKPLNLNPFSSGRSAFETPPAREDILGDALRGLGSFLSENEQSEKFSRKDSSSLTGVNIPENYSLPSTIPERIAREVKKANALKKNSHVDDVSVKINGVKKKKSSPSSKSSKSSSKLLGGNITNVVDMFSPDSVDQYFNAAINSSDKQMRTSINTLIARSGGRRSDIFKLADLDGDKRISNSEMISHLKKVRQITLDRYSRIYNNVFGGENGDGLYSSVNVKGQRFLSGNANRAILDKVLPKAKSALGDISAFSSLSNKKDSTSVILTSLFGHDFIPSFVNLERDINRISKFNNTGDVRKTGLAVVHKGESVVKGAGKSNAGSYMGLNDAISSFNQKPSWMADFSDTVNKLANTSIKVELAPTQVTARIVGGELLQNIDGMIKREVEDSIMKAVRNIYHSDNTGSHGIRK